ncbi:MAG: hypothetical protein JSW67_05240 [Candidatus Latescibacterota bacterium]|nr:MAG: hypothetical protein JSW67_05240 [Candidatus Latescibacterota bacterium]
MARTFFVCCFFLGTALALPSVAGSAADGVAADSTTLTSVATAPDSMVIPRQRLSVRHTQIAVLRAGAGAHHPIVTTVQEEQVLVADARTGPWFHVTTPEGLSGWLHESLLANDVDRTQFQFKPDPGRLERQGSLSLALYAGSYAADREDNGFLYGARFGYAFTSRFTFEVAAGRTRVERNTFIIEQLFNLRIEEETFDVFFYEAGLNVHLLPRRRVVPFVGAALGATVLNSRVEPTWSLGIGTLAFVSRRIALRWEIRDHRLEAGNQFTRFTGDNIEFSAGTQVLF